MFIDHLESLKMKEEDKEMYVSVFERVYTARGIERGIEQGIEQGIVQGIEQGREQGREQGIEQGKREVAKNFLADGVSPDVVARNTGLSIDEILDLMN
ncbi:MAG: hypothetical protein LBT08_10315 [Synergistaceae bacterium]|jgi:predicted transposase/invertase (TIGR01784 family)|nr:hypothetical protein [Synergistaceae bacterium]